jgi:tripartite-type tricarboxylate transporter receptor subunit TctC
LCSAGVGLSVHAQTYPVKSLRLVSPFPSGSSADSTSRLYGASLGQPLGQQFIVDNRPGAAGNIGAQVVAR